MSTKSRTLEEESKKGGDSSSNTTNVDNNNNMNDYCKKLESWLWQAYCQRAVATSAYFTALNTYYGNSVPPIPTGNGSLPNNFMRHNVGAQPQQPDAQRMNEGQWAQPGQPQAPQPQQQQRQTQFIFAGAGLAGLIGAPGVGVLVKIAPVWKRLLAELIDFGVLLVIKLFVTFTVIDSFDLIDLDSIDLDALRAEAADGDSRQGLYDIAFSLTSELILLELTHRIVVCFFEGYCLWKAGGTPGKTLLGLRVIHADDVLPYTPPRNINNNNNQQLPQILWDVTAQTAIVRPGSFLTFPRAFLRAVLKNFSLAFFFPLCFTLFHFDYSRTLYDLMAKSIVIEV